MDLSKDFYAFGEKPKFGDTFYLANGEVFAQGDATVTVAVNITDPKSGIAKAKTDGKPRLAWEFWNGQTWALIGTSTTADDGTPAPNATFTDTSRAFTQDGVVTFTFSQPPRVSMVNGIQNYWVRVRIVGGDYGKEASYTPKQAPADGYVYNPATFTPPSLQPLSLGYQVTRSAVMSQVLADNDFEQVTLPLPCAPFIRTDDPTPALYLGFTLPSGLADFPGHPTSLYFQTGAVPYGAAPDNPAPPARPGWSGNARPMLAGCACQWWMRQTPSPNRVWSNLSRPSGT